jgi:hypothetical protein
MTAIPTLLAVLLANSITVQIPRLKPALALLDEPLSTRRIQLLTTAFRTDWLIILCHRTRIRSILAESGHMRFLDRIEADQNSGWRIHFFCLHEAAVRLIADACGEGCGSDSPTTFDPQRFVLARLRNLQRVGKLKQQTPWWDTDVE